MIHTRRKFLTGLGSMLAAPAIVHAGNLMPVKALKIHPFEMSPIDIENAELMQFLYGISQKIAHTLYYGNPEESPLQFTGFSQFAFTKYEDRTS